MVWGHLFYSEDKCPGIIPIYRLSSGITLEKLLGDFISCVSLYAFITGYGLCKSVMKGQNSKFNCKNQLLCDGKRIFRSWFSLMKKFWLVFLIFVPIGLLFFKKTWGFSDLFFNFIGLKSTINAEWWYIRFYITILILFPFMDIIISFIVERWGQKICALFFLVATGISLIFSKTRSMVLMGSYYVFIVGYLCAKFNFLENIQIKKKFRYLSGLLLIAIWGLKIIIVEQWFGDDYCKMFDFFLVPLFVWALIQCYGLFPNWLTNILKLFGRYSTFIWLTHTFFCYYYWQELIVLPKYSILVFAWLMLISLAVAAVLEKIDEGIKFN